MVGETNRQQKKTKDKKTKKVKYKKKTKKTSLPPVVLREGGRGSEAD